MCFTKGQKLDNKVIYTKYYQKYISNNLTAHAMHSKQKFATFLAIP